MLLERRSSERSPARHRAIDRASGFALVWAFILDRDLDPRSDRRPIAFHSHQLQTDPVIAISRILKQPERVAVTGDSATDLCQQILIAVAFNVRKRHSMAFV